MRLTDDEGVLTDDACRWLLMLAFVAALAIVSYMGQHDTRDDPPRSAPTTTSTTSTSTTTTTPPPPSSTTLPAPVAATAPTTTLPRQLVKRPASVEWAVSSTVYCLHGVTASGQHTGPGVVAVSYADFPRLRGTRWRVIAGPPEILGRTFTVADKGPAAHFDVWMGDHPNCPTWGRYTYGRKPARVTPA